MKPTRINKHGKVLKGRSIKPATDEQIKQGRKALKEGTAVIAVDFKKKGPPPPPKHIDLLLHHKAPPPPPPPSGVMSKLGPRPDGATHVEYHRPPLYVGDVMKDPGVTIVVPADKAAQDFSSFKSGTVRWGRLRWETDFVPHGGEPSSEEATIEPRPVVVKEPKVAGPKREGVCAFIDALIMTGKHSAQAIADLTLKQFPGRDAKSTLNTVKVRPAHIKAKGLVPPPFKS